MQFIAVISKAIAPMRSRKDRNKLINWKEEMIWLQTYANFEVFIHGVHEIHLGPSS